MKGSQIAAVLRCFWSSLKATSQTSGFDLRNHNGVIVAKECLIGFVLSATEH